MISLASRPPHTPTIPAPLLIKQGDSSTHSCTAHTTAQQQDLNTNQFAGPSCLSPPRVIRTSNFLECVMVVLSQPRGAWLFNSQAGLHEDHR